MKRQLLHVQNNCSVFLSAHLYIKTMLTVQPKHCSDFVVMVKWIKTGLSTNGAGKVFAPS